MEREAEGTLGRTILGKEAAGKRRECEGEDETRGCISGSIDIGAVKPPCYRAACRLRVGLNKSYYQMNTRFSRVKEQLTGVSASTWDNLVLAELGIILQPIRTLLFGRLVEVCRGGYDVLFVVLLL